ncbi:MAG: hypothetical protein P1U53_18425 [Sulfitobacter sp.]|nr:hypothetical protein [Sulfitobacter sp.]
MARNKTAAQPGKGASVREDRLKAALKANMARRKAQARARAEQAADDKAPQGGIEESENGSD